MPQNSQLPEPIVVDCQRTPLEKLMDMEWLITNKLGSYASSNVLGANTRRYHGVLVAANLPPVGREVVLSLLMEQLVIGEKLVDLSTFQFTGAVSPTGYKHLVRFINDIAPTWVFQYEDVTVTKQLMLAEQSNVVAVRYKVEAPRPVTLRVWPFLALRDFHGLRRVHEPHQMTYVAGADRVQIEDRQQHASPAWVTFPQAEFIGRPQWWYKFLYPVEISRGQEGVEDLYTPGWFQLTVGDSQWRQLDASLEPTGPMDFDAVAQSRRHRLEGLVAAVGEGQDETTRRLSMATDAFVVTRQMPAGPSATIVAGYHWFGDWGRDTFISLPGLELVTRQYEKARQILRTFTHAMRDGIIPNRFDDYGGPPHYNTMDASLWYVLAVDRYVQASGDQESWRREFIGAVREILRAYRDGTQFGIHADGDGLITGGSPDSQLTWMDVKFNNQAITPRHGKTVEINAMYLEGLHILAERCRGIDDGAANWYAGEAERVAKSFVKAFWYEQGGYLYDCVTPEFADASLRPNQVIAVAMPHCPLSLSQQQSVLRVAIDNLLTPVGLRTLAPSDPRYRGTCSGSWESRDRAYHQGTVWPWLMGPMVQAYLKVHNFSDASRRQAARWLQPFDQNLRECGLGQISEIMDGNAPHAPRGCIAQAWSVAEVLRAKLMVQHGQMI